MLSFKIPQVFFAQYFGGKRPFLCAIYYAGLAALGGFAAYRRIDWSKISRVIFVCKGNICRSAYAERKFISLGGSAVSAGLAADGKPANPSAQRVASRRQISLEHHYSQPIQNLPLTSGDLLIAFEPEHAKLLTSLVQDIADVQVTLLGLWSNRPFWFYLHDPYGLSDAYFNHCFDRIDKGIIGVLNHLTNRSNQGATQ